MNASRIYQAGFTMLELIIVMVILSLVVGVAVPKYSNSLGIKRVEGAAYRLVFDIEAVRRQARIAAQTTSVTFETSGNLYTLDGVPDPDRPSISNKVVPLNDSLLQVTLQQVNLTGGGNAISFNGFGFPDRGGTITLSSGSARMHVLVDATTGMASVQPVPSQVVTEIEP
jgi:prepilin-type N-terminal cleavage/methylation domain-containing protein